MTGVPPLTPTTAAHYGPVDRRQSAAANPLVTVVTAPMADHNIHRGRFGAFMAEVESFLRDCPLISSRQKGAKIGRRRGRAGNSSVTPDNADWSGARDGG